MNTELQRIVLLGTLGYTFYMVASCPCKDMGICKKEQFLALTAVPFGFAVVNFFIEDVSKPSFR